MPATAARCGRRRRYGAVAALRDLSLSVERGEMFGLIGPDGAGKTTTIRLMCGLLHPDGGSVRVLGRDPVRDHRRRDADRSATCRSGSASTAISPSTRTSRSSPRSTASHARLGHSRSPRSPARADAADAVPHAARRPAVGRHEAEAGAGVHAGARAEVILLDEPTTGVDPVSRREFWKLLSEFLAQGITILMATPYLDEAERCSRVALLHEGRLLALDTPAQSARRPCPASSWRSSRPIAIARPSVLERLPGVADVQLFGERAHVRIAAGRAVERPQQLRRRCDGRLAVESVRRVPASLEDVFIARVAKEAA